MARKHLFLCDDDDDDDDDDDVMMMVMMMMKIWLGSVSAWPNSNMPRAGLEPGQKLNIGFAERSCGAVITTTSKHHLSRRKCLA